MSDSGHDSGYMSMCDSMYDLYIIQGVPKVRPVRGVISQVVQIVRKWHGCYIVAYAIFILLEV
jgi:hypothetical protein